MESKHKVFSPEELIPVLLEVLETTELVPLVISGSSMNPFLVHGRDIVYLSKIYCPLKRGDMVLYRRNNGQYVIHRIYRCHLQTFTMVGDAQTSLEAGIRPEQILARVCMVRRKDRLLKPGCFWWEFFQRIWIRLIPLRPGIFAIYSKISHLFR